MQFRNLHLQPFTLTQDLNLYKQKATMHYQFRFLPENTNTQILFEIDFSIGRPLKPDKNVDEADNGHFARVLVDIDLAKPLDYTLLLTEKEALFLPLLNMEISLICS